MSRSTEFIPFARASTDTQEEEAVIRVLRSGWLTTGEEALAFEREFASAVGVSHALAVNSATAGLHLALEAAGIGAGDLVVTTPYTFTASAEIARYLQADPLFVDISEDDLNIDPDQIARAVESNHRVKAIVPVHIGGHPCRMPRILEIARKHDLAVIEDAAHVSPVPADAESQSTWPAGSRGDAGVFSFYATKPITTGEGGMVVTDDDDLARRISVMRLHGIDRDAWDRYTAQSAAWEYGVVAAGFKYNMPDLLASIGRVQLRKAAAFMRRRREVAEQYRDGLRELDYLRLPEPSATSSWHLYVVRLVESRVSITRDEFARKLVADGVGVSVHYRPLHLMPFYRDRYGLRPEDFPVSLSAYQTAISLPIYPSLADEDVDRVVRSVMRIGDSALVR
jgi:dTDP-4-amino-4,6-dideoxygalactose transaminase